MLIFHEGLPGSGKSYEAMVKHVFPALLKGREVYAYVEGLDHEKIAEVLDLPIETVRNLLHQITREQVPEIHLHVANDALVVIDELQNFWPSGRAKLSPEIVQFLTEHRHRGLDIVAMGQALADCHAMWRRRVGMRISFLQREALGKPNEYTWRLYKCVDPKTEKYEKITSGGGTYEAKYFGTYASHTTETENVGTYADDRANIWKTPMFRKWLPLGLVISVIAIGYIVYLFRGGLADMTTRKSDQAAGTGEYRKQLSSEELLRQVDKGAGLVERTKAEQLQKEKPVSKPKEPELSAPSDWVAELVKKYRPRLAGYVSGSGRTLGSVEFWGDGQDIRERLSFHQLGGLGWLVLVAPDGSIATMQRGEVKVVVTTWPIDEGRTKVSDARNNEIRALSSGPGLVAPASIGIAPVASAVTGR